jgi:hypothetical protein
MSWLNNNPRTWAVVELGSRLRRRNTRLHRKIATVALSALKDKLGLELVKARRSIKMLVVERYDTVQKH